MLCGGQGSFRGFADHPPVRAQDTPSTQELADLRARAEAGEAQAQFTLGRRYGARQAALAGPIWHYVALRGTTWHKINPYM